ncbi:metalloproteinase inhibitor 2-like [Acanthaster planci]|uniref:Metalloproteinase inhibitor 2-like n=1 Tax=Acanthaster planci TaxID=133434 RepID=A0A8B7Z627_ACAPL|nr:metalloproteinase inhibitor 2-like [Acanthaster planci]
MMLLTLNGLSLHHPKMLLFCMILPFIMAYAEASECRKHPQQYVCDADFVIKGKILSRTSAQDWLNPKICVARYNVNITAIFKGIQFVATENQYIHGIRESCNEKGGLDIGDKYIITGYQSDNKLKSGDCQWIVKWSSLTKLQQQALIHDAYTDNCDYCQISRFAFRAFNSLQRPEAVGDTCSYDFSSENGQKQRQKMSCLRRGTSQNCSWMRNDLYEKFRNLHALPEILIN